MSKFPKRIAKLVYKTGQLASEHFQFGPSVRQSQELLTLMWSPNCYNPQPSVQSRQWMIKTLTKQHSYKEKGRVLLLKSTQFWIFLSMRRQSPCWCPSHPSNEWFPIQPSPGSFMLCGWYRSDIDTNFLTQWSLKVVKHKHYLSNWKGSR